MRLQMKGDNEDLREPRQNHMCSQIFKKIGQRQQHQGHVVISLPDSPTPSKRSSPLCRLRHMAVIVAPGQPDSGALCSLTQDTGGLGTKLDPLLSNDRSRSLDLV